jgi:REP element-mobilizing transposase RayT
MPQSLARLNIHLIFSTKHRARVLTDHIRGQLHGYTATVMDNFGCHAILLNSVEDHIHLLFELGRTVAISKAVEEIKTTSSKWIKTQGPEFGTFAWQSGYAAFSVDMSSLARVREYIANQRDHHRVETFQDEYRRFLSEHAVGFDERYMWD